MLCRLHDDDAARGEIAAEVREHIGTRGLVQGEAGACGPGALNRIGPTGAFSGALRDSQLRLQCGCPSVRRRVSAP